MDSCMFCVAYAGVCQFCKPRFDMALNSFQEVLNKEPGKNQLLALEEAGWKEGCPMEDGWNFSHQDFLDVRIFWKPGHRPRY